jgi:hypothetical protein
VLLLALIITGARWLSRPGPRIDRTVYVAVTESGAAPSDVTVFPGERVKVVFHNDTRLPRAVSFGGRPVVLPAGRTGSIVRRFAPGSTSVSTSVATG